jgi:hypothetical protein
MNIHEYLEYLQYFFDTLHVEIPERANHKIAVSDVASSVMFGTLDTRSLGSLAEHASTSI